MLGGFRHRAARFADESALLRVVVGEFSVLGLLAAAEFALGFAAVCIVAAGFVTLKANELRQDTRLLRGRRGERTSGIHFLEFHGLQLGSLYILSTFSSERLDDS